MDAESSFLQVSPPVFDGESYDLWEVKIVGQMTSIILRRGELIFH